MPLLLFAGLTAESVSAPATEIALAPEAISAATVIPLASLASDDIAARIKSLLPTWWAFVAPVRDAIAGASADCLAAIYSLIGFVRDQTRLATVSGIFVDIFSFDYLGMALPRRTGEGDPFYAMRVKKEIVRERVTRQGMSQALLDLTGFAPVIIEPFNGGDVGAWDVSWWGWDVGNGNSAPASLTGNPIAWGDSFTGQVFITVQRTGVGVGIANAGGWDTGFIGWDQAGEWIDAGMITGAVTDQDIYDCINRTKPEGVTAWVQLV